ncbi:uncharacterized protein LOC133039487 [Cannabis sativa]|nr:uncharacterized protein LOC133039026 [Cannabis sativa]XP_060974381.1 uncharacterized protein LOC133039487 [Cannabis sativa]
MTVKCRCRPPKRSMIFTSWTDANPGRRFMRCPLYNQVGGCKFWEWYDPPMCERAAVVIPGLLRKIGKLEDELSSMTSKIAELSSMSKINEHSSMLKFDEDPDLTNMDEGYNESFDDSSPSILVPENKSSQTFRFVLICIVVIFAFLWLKS